MKKRVLITGASGFVGKNLIKKLSSEFEVFGTYYSNKKAGLYYLDIADGERVADIFAEIKPDIVIHAAAVPNVDHCEINKVAAKKINFDGTNNLIEACKSFGAKLVLISTDYVFDGKNGPYTEDAETNPLNYYGRLKLLAEKEIESRLKKYLIIRTTNVYGYDAESKNFAMFVLEKLKRGESVTVAKDQYGNPTYVENLAEAIVELILKNKTGVYNVAGPDNVNRVEFAQKIAEVFGYDKNLVVGRTTEELKQDAPRPKKSGFIIEKIKRELKIGMLSTEEGAKLMKSKMNSG